MSIVDKIKGSDNLDNAITFKVNSAYKDELIEFCKVRKISMGKLIREAIDIIVEEIEREERVVMCENCGDEITSRKEEGLISTEETPICVLCSPHASKE